MIRKCGVKAFAQIAVLLGARYIAVAHAVEITHKQGSLDVPFDPKPTLIFYPAARDTLDTLGVDVQGVGEDNFLLLFLLQLILRFWSVAAVGRRPPLAVSASAAG